MRVLLTGGTGLIGTQLTHALLERGDDVAVLTRNPVSAQRPLPRYEVYDWNPPNEPAPTEALSNADAVIHLAGEKIDQRWTEEAKAKIRESRVVGTRNLVQGIKDSTNPPKTLIVANAVGYYGPHEAEVVDESSDPGGDFLAEICQAWETEALVAQELGLRVVTVRTGIVLERDGGALGKMAPIFRFGIGGPIGRGRHYMSWIHLEDLVRIYLYALDSSTLSGPINATAPNPTTNREFSKTLGRAIHRPAVLPVPPFALKIIYGKMSSIVTTGQRVVPKRLQESGFNFKHTDLLEALESALHQTT
jgi:uncharacterized protein (TIGR01777 family)